MKAAIINHFGESSVFEIDEIEKPIIHADQLLVKVKSVGINPIDWKQRKGNHKLILGSPFPIVLGYDVCGEVVEVGSEIKRFKKGDLVFGVLDNKYGGALGEFAMGHENCFSIKPDRLSIEEASALGMVSLTSLQAFRDTVGLKKGQTVLIYGASGGVGHVAIQIAKILGAKVIAVSSTESQEFVEQFKPDIFIDYKKQDLFKQNLKVDVFADLASKSSFAQTKSILNPGGVYLNLEYINTLKKMPIHWIHQWFAKGKKVKTLLMKQNKADLDLIAQWVREEKLKVMIDKSFSLDQISAAHEYAQQGHNKGKNVVVISN